MEKLKLIHGSSEPGKPKPTKGAAAKMFRAKVRDHNRQFERGKK